MKTVYNTDWLDHLLVRKLVKKWARQGLVSEEEKVTIFEAYQSRFYMPHFWISNGLFIFTIVLLFAAMGLMGLMFFSNASDAEPVVQLLLVAFGVGCLLVGEYYKKQKHYFQAGVDNALVYMALGLVLTVATWMVSDFERSDFAIVPVSLLATALFMWTAYRYLDPILAFAAICAWFISLFFFCAELGTVGKAIIPFVGCINAVCIYFAIKKWAHQDKWRYHSACFKVMEITSLLLSYLSVNYFVVRELSAELFPNSLQSNNEIPFAFLFYFFTVSIPPAYIYIGLWQKDRVILRIGLLLIVLSIWTIRYYHALLPIEIALTISGLLLLGLSYSVIRWLNAPQKGFTYEAEIDTDLRIVESLILVQSFSKGSTPEQGTQFGGGDFGGAGASGTY